ncbi:MAG: phosphoenolpyruvate--protein phosphotransferase [Thermodesulfobacteriota bacterium]
MSDNRAIIVYGIGISPGIAIGPILSLGRSEGRRGWQGPASSGAEQERVRFRRAVDQVETQLLELRERYASARKRSDEADIVESHLLMLRDRMLFSRTLSLIGQDGMDALRAFRQAVNEARAMFTRIGDPYLRERIQDVEQVAARVRRQLEGKPEPSFADATGRAVVVGVDFAPEDVLRMREDGVQGFISEKGGPTSHAAIVARSLGMPAVAGAAEAVRLATSGDLIILDGSSGRIILRPGREDLDRYRERQQQEQQRKEQDATALPPETETSDGRVVIVDAAIAAASETGPALGKGAVGIGLFRSEYDYLGRPSLPDEEMLFSVYRQVLSTAAPHTVTIRTLDAGGDKSVAGLGPAGEANPALGLRGIRFSLRQPDIFRTQLRALLRASSFGSLRIMFPMVASLDDLRKAKAALATARSELAGRGQACQERIPVGVMVEVPAAVAIVDLLAKEADFLSIGTNDLIQYALAIDRGNEQVAHLYEPLHPAVLRMIRQVIEAGRAAGIEVGLCGEMAGDPRCLPVLLGLGLGQLTVRQDVLSLVKRMVRDCSLAEAEGLVREVFACPTAREVRIAIDGFFARCLPRWRLEAEEGLPVARSGFGVV